MIRRGIKFVWVGTLGLLSVATVAGWIRSYHAHDELSVTSRMGISKPVIREWILESDSGGISLYYSADHFKNPVVQKPDPSTFASWDRDQPRQYSDVVRSHSDQGGQSLWNKMGIYLLYDYQINPHYPVPYNVADNPLDYTVEADATVPYWSMTLLALVTLTLPLVKLISTAREIGMLPRLQL